MTEKEPRVRRSSPDELVQQDTKLAEVLLSLEKALPPAEMEKDRPRLRVPYATAVPIVPD